MTSVTLPNALEGHTPPETPLKTNGDFYEYFMSYENNRYLVYAESIAELFDSLIPGYSSSSEEDKILSRIRLAMNVQTQAQGYLIASLDDEKRKNLAEWEYKVLIHEDTSSPHSWGNKAGETVEESSGETIDIWYSDIPLVLLDTGYAPYTDVPRPISALGSSKLEKNLIWLEPGEEKTFIESLERIGYIYFAKRIHQQ